MYFSLPSYSSFFEAFLSKAEQTLTHNSTDIKGWRGEEISLGVCGNYETLAVPNTEDLFLTIGDLKDGLLMWDVKLQGIFMFHYD